MTYYLVYGPLVIGPFPTKAAAEAAAATRPGSHVETR